VRKVYIIIFLISLSSLIAWVFWVQQLKYLLPTPIPENYHKVSVYQHLNLSNISKDNKPLLLHFFNPDCPCSRFNLKHIRTLFLHHKNEVRFIAVIPFFADLDKAKSMLEEEMEVIKDSETKELAVECGVYSTPQAVILTPDRNLYYRGNYNKARYCSRKESSYAQIALNDLLNNKPTPNFDGQATKSYGCSIYIKEK